jgi:hypothetical protein
MMKWKLTTAGASAVDVTVVGETEIKEQALERRASRGVEVAGGTVNVCLATSRWRWCRLTQYALTGDM